jgi:hypothetical protein
MGLPGGFSWAFVLVAMIAYGISPGPPMLTRYADITTLIVISLVLGNAVLAIVGLLASGHLAKLSKVPYPLIAAAIIPLAFLSAFQSSLHWTAIPLVLGFGAIGMLMKMFRWPRPPMILGFILGPIIERNLLSAVSIHGPMGMMTRPITIILMVLSVVVLVGFSWIATKTEKQEEAMTHGGDSDGGKPAPIMGGSGTLVWRSWEHAFPLATFAIALAFFVVALDFQYQARSMPIMVSVGLMVLAIMQFGLQLRGVRSGDILDLGMLSQGPEQRWTAKILLALLAGFVFLSMAVGLKWAALALAIAFPGAVSGKESRKFGLLTGAFVALLVFGLFDRVLFIIWPEPIIWAFVRDLFISSD